MQMFLDIDCRDLKYTYAPTREIDAAVLRLEQKLRGLKQSLHLANKNVTFILDILSDLLTAL